MNTDKLDRLIQAIREHGAVVSAAIGGVEQAIRDVKLPPPPSSKSKQKAVKP